ncbi:MAG: 1,4-dihydroxy-2-naphthoate octaprenyltransferase [Phycisphaerales bacterium]|nr:1,4-dihydroxy-2-naphthoate octaprenyltransferase [Phycisphaerales bacterium]
MNGAGAQPHPAPGARAWIGAIRAKTLGASLCPVAMGAGLAWHDGAFAWIPVVAALAGAGLLQVASNLANDLFDGLRGTDSGARIGPVRAVASGAISARAMAVALALVLAAAAVPAAWLSMHAGAWFAVIGVAGAVSAVAYTAGPMPLAYVGLGDLFVFAFFGPVAVAGTRAACDGTWSGEAAFLGIAPGAIGMCLLATNNLRDRVGDAESGKRTLIVRCGERFGRALIATCHAAAIAVPVATWAAWQLPAGAMAASAVAAGFVPVSVAVLRGRDGTALNRTLAGFGAMLYAYGVAFAAGLVLTPGAGDAS